MANIPFDPKKRKLLFDIKKIQKDVSKKAEKLLIKSKRLGVSPELQEKVKLKTFAESGFRRAAKGLEEQYKSSFNRRLRKAIEEESKKIAKQPKRRPPLRSLTANPVKEPVVQWTKPDMFNFEKQRSFEKRAFLSKVSREASRRGAKISERDIMVKTAVSKVKGSNLGLEDFLIRAKLLKDFQSEGYSKDFIDKHLMEMAGPTKGVGIKARPLASLATREKLIKAGRWGKISKRLKGLGKLTPMLMLLDIPQMKKQSDIMKIHRRETGKPFMTEDPEKWLEKYKAEMHKRGKLG